MASKKATPVDDDDVPRYRLTEKAYFDKIYNEDDEVATEGIPGHHMIPLNDAAREKAKNIPPYRDPINSIPIGTMADTNPPDVT